MRFGTFLLLLGISERRISPPTSFVLRKPSKDADSCAPGLDCMRQTSTFSANKTIGREENLSDVNPNPSQWHFSGVVQPTIVPGLGVLHLRSDFWQKEFNPLP